MKPEYEPTGCEGLDPPLREALEEIRNEPLDNAAVEAAASRVWAHIRGELQPSLVIRGCADFQALMPRYRAGHLDEARAILLKDHLHECVACRRALAPPSPSKVVEIPGRRPRTASWPGRPAVRWVAAAVLVLGAGIAAWNVILSLPDAARGEITVQSSTGTLYRMPADSAVPLLAGDSLPAGTEIRTAKDSGAVVRLADGSQVELGARSGLSVSATGRDTTIRLSRGAIIVEAAKQRNGRLYVKTGDVNVSVTGTVFSVDSGVKGSRVSVVEGEVRVGQSGRQTVLHPGDQYTSSPALFRNTVADDIAWSRNAGQHLALLKEFTALRRQLEQVPGPGLRYSPRLLESVPPDTALFAGIPNLGKNLAETYKVFRDRMRESAVLRQWWSGQDHRKMDVLIEEFRAFSEYLGDEVILIAPAGPEGRMAKAAMLAEVTRPGLREFMLARELHLGPDAAREKLLLFDSAAAIRDPAPGEAVVYLTGNFVAMSRDAGMLRAIARARQGGPSFASTPFAGRIRNVYADGAGILMAADLERLGAGEPHLRTGAAPLALGGIQQILVEQKELQGQTNTRATFRFSGQRSGIASWLARPAPINALDFISPEASALGAFALRTPATIVDELVSMAGKDNAAFLEHLAAAEHQSGLSLRDDLVATLGAEVAFALDGPAFPTPSWKLVMEVYDPARLQSSLERILDAANARIKDAGQPPLRLDREALDGRLFYRLATPLPARVREIDYVFADGYLVAAPSRALLEQALRYRASRTGIAHSARFTSLLPPDRYANVSGVLFHNLGATLGLLAEGFAAAGNLTPEQRGAIAGFTRDVKPALVAIYAEDDRVVVATTSSAISLSAANLLAMQGPAGMAEMLASSRPAR